jgi:hypothetical protein
MAAWTWPIYVVNMSVCVYDPTVIYMYAESFFIMSSVHFCTMLNEGGELMRGHGSHPMTSRLSTVSALVLRGLQLINLTNLLVVSSIFRILSTIVRKDHNKPGIIWQ